MASRAFVCSAVALLVGCGSSSREAPRGEATPPQQAEPEPQAAPRDEPASELAQDVPAPAEPDPPSPPVCLAPLPSLPPDVPEDGRRCLEGLTAARERFGFFAPPSAESEPCAVEELRDDGTVYWRGVVSRPAPSQRMVSFGPIDDGGLPTSMRRTSYRDGKGREVRLDEVWDQYVEGVDTPDCTNTSETRHTLDRKGWPRRSTKVIESCEGVDAGVIMTSRRFTAGEDLVTAKLSVVDRGTKLTGKAWWLPVPIRPLAWGTTDHYGDAECWLEVRGCDGAVLGRMHGRDDGVHEVERHVWVCENPPDPS